MAINTSDSITELSALNIMATYLGIPALLDISDLAQEPDLLIAQRILNTTTREVLNRGLEINSDCGFTISPELDGTILVPAGNLRWSVQYDYEERYVERDGKVYDKRDMTDQFTGDLVIDVVWNFDFASMPEMIKNYITVKSSFRFVARMKGSDSVLNTIQQDLVDAEYEFHRYTNGTSQRTLLDNRDVDLIVSRHLDYNHHYR
jgi:hypothetical protein